VPYVVASVATDEVHVIDSPTREQQALLEEQEAREDEFLVVWVFSRDLLPQAIARGRAYLEEMKRRAAFAAAERTKPGGDSDPR
jgi:hypothetical protein